MKARLFGIDFRLAVALVIGALVITLATAQQTPPAGSAPGTAAAPGAGGRGGGGGFGRGATPVAYDDYAGFTKLWDGQTLNNWDGESDVWSIDNGAIHADTTKTPGQHHIHYRGPGAVMRDFDLKVEMKMSETGANGGIQYRSRLLNAYRGGSIENPLGRAMPSGVTTLEQAIAAGITTRASERQPGAGGDRGAGQGSGATDPAAAAQAAAGRGGRAGGDTASGGAAQAGQAGRGGVSPDPINPWQVSGYQYDMDSNNRFTGGLYEGQVRGIVNTPGGLVLLQPGRVSARIGTINANPAAAVKPLKGIEGEWNQIEIIARGNTLVHMINGQVITVTIDDNPDARAYQGILSLQLEGSGQIWYRNVYVKQFDKPMEFPK